MPWQLGDPPPQPSNITLLWATWLSCWGASVAYLQQLKDGQTKFSVIAFLTDNLTAMLAGYLSLHVCAYLKVDPVLVAPIIAIAGLNSALALRILRRRLVSAIK